MNSNKPELVSLRSWRRIIIWTTCLAAAFPDNFSTGSWAAEPLRFVDTIPLPGVEGRIDHMALDIAGQRLFVAALGNNTVEVVDLGARR